MLKTTDFQITNQACNHRPFSATNNSFKLRDRNSKATIHSCVLVFHKTLSKLAVVHFLCTFTWQIVVKVWVNVFWLKISIFSFLHFLIAELSRHTMITCWKLRGSMKMEEISCKSRFPSFLVKLLVGGLQNPILITWPVKATIPMPSWCV